MKIFFLLAIMFNLNQVASAQSAVSTVNWKTQKATFELKQKSLEDAALLFTSQTGCSLLIDGELALKNANITFAGTAAQALDKIADVLITPGRSAKAALF